MLCKRSWAGRVIAFTVHGPEEFDGASLALALAVKVERSAFAVAISEFGRANSIGGLTIVDWTKIHVVRCGLDSLFLDGRLRSRRRPRASTGLQSGDWSSRKGQLILLEAAARLQAEGSISRSCSSATARCAVSLSLR